VGCLRRSPRVWGLWDTGPLTKSDGRAHQAPWPGPWRWGDTAPPGKAGGTRPPTWSPSSAHHLESRLGGFRGESLSFTWPCPWAFPKSGRPTAIWEQTLGHSEPIREVLESDESDVIHCWALDSLESARCGSLNTALRRTAVAFVTRAI
jgi:hypothetical protein